MIKNKKIMAATLTLMLGTFAFAGCTTDTTGAEGWKEGEHEGYSAGQDLTAAFESSPHKESILNGLEIMGKLAD